MTTPGSNRTDEVYVDFYFAEVSNDVGSEYQDAALEVSGIGSTTANRVRQVQDIRVAEGTTTPVNGVDGNGIYHWYIKIATLNRTGGNITNAQIVDERILIDSVNTISTSLNSFNDKEIVHGNGSVLGQTANIVINNGKMGIGTANPLSNFEIASTNLGGTLNTSNTLLIKNLNSSPGNGSTTYNNSSVRVESSNVVTGALTSYYNDNGSGINIGSVSNHDVNLVVSTDSKVIIKTDGNVGIGTTNPINKFQILGTPIDGQSDFNLNYYLHMGSSLVDATNSFMANTYDSNDNGRFDIRMKGTALTDAKLTIRGSGNVGVFDF